jgi:zinc protease
MKSLPSFRPLRSAALTIVSLLAIVPAAKAIDIERVVSPGGIEAWLVTESAIPLITMNVAFRGGAAQDPEDLPGVAEMVSGLLDQGAGEFDAQAFQQRLRDTHVELSFSAARDAFYGQMRTLSENRDEGFDLIRLALTEPRFDEDALELRRGQTEASLRRELQDPNSIAGRSWSEAMFGTEHPYGRPVRGSLESVAAITSADLRAFHRGILARDNLFIAVVGDIDAETLAPLLDKVFGPLPEISDLTPVPEPEIGVRDGQVLIDMEIPQTVMQFGRPGLKRDDDDFMAAFVVNHILGGGSFSSRLYREVRELRGLAYSVYTFLYTLENTGLFAGGVATRNDRAGESLAIIREEIRRMASEGPREEELNDAKRYLTGAYALRFETSGSIARQLVQIQLDELGIDYVNIRNDLIDALTIDDVRRAAQRLLDDGTLLVTLVGQPEGLDDADGGG